MRAAPDLESIIQATVNWKNEDKTFQEDSIVGFCRGEVLFQIENRKYSGEVVLGYNKSGNLMFHDIVKIFPKELK